ncbi:MAG: IgGFc-binding protein, partial [Bacteroidota bacterium]
MQTINLGPNAAQSLDLTPWIDIIENKPANSVLNYGFKIHSTAPIMAYYEVVTSCNCNPDIFALKGKNALGTSFIITAQTFLNNANYARSGFDIVATQNNTSITIIPSNAIVGHAAGIPFTIVLNQGETFSAEASGIAGNVHLSGSTVVANKPIAVTIKDDSMSGAPYGGCADLMGDQTIPVPVTGKEYITLKGYLNGPDKVYVVATQNNTQVSIDGVNVGTLNATNLYVHTQSNPSA